MKVVMTGAAGGVGTMTRPFLRESIDDLVLSDIADIDDLADGESFVRADITDLGEMEHLLEGADGLIHLGGQSVEGDWATVLALNIDGLYNAYEAARRQGVGRIVFATTNHVVGFYRRQRTIDHTVMPRPDSRYGVSKAFGEAMGRLYADKHGIGVLNVRIGNCDFRPLDIRRLSIWLHPEDFAQLCMIGLTHPDLHYEVVYGASRCVRSWWDNGNAYRLGYRPKHDSEDHAEHAHAEALKKPEDRITHQFQGGTFPAAEFTGDVKRID